jgi:hypothetical protein
VTSDFDFWLGTWEVHSREGVFLGRNRVEAILAGTVIQEHWEGATGGRGTSLNAFVPEKEVWRQTWVDDQGNFLDLEGGLTGTRMILCGISSSTAGPLSERIAWTPLADGRVLQLWEQSLDAGATWKMAFEGFYTRIN